MNEKQIRVLQAVCNEDNYKLSVMSVESGTKPSEDVVRKEIEFVQDIYEDDQELIDQFEEGVKNICNFAEATDIKSYTFFWETTKLYF